MNNYQLPVFHVCVWEMTRERHELLILTGQTKCSAGDAEPPMKKDAQQMLDLANIRVIIEPCHAQMCSAYRRLSY